MSHQYSTGLQLGPLRYQFKKCKSGQADALLGEVMLVCKMRHSSTPFLRYVAETPAGQLATLVTLASI